MVLKFLATKGLGLLGKGKKFIKTDPKIIIKPAKDPDVIKLNKQIGVAKKISLKGNTVVLATAHPSKFSDVAMEATGIRPELPENLKNILVEKENYDKLPKDLEKVKNYILERV